MLKDKFNLVLFDFFYTMIKKCNLLVPTKKKEKKEKLLPKSGPNRCLTDLLAA